MRSIDLPASFEQLAATQSNVGRMRAAGVERRDRHDQRRRGAAGAALDPICRQSRRHRPGCPARTGLSWSQAFAAISSGPAEALGLGGEIGSLRPGRRADVVIWDGDPLELATGVEAVWIDGVRQRLDNRQTKLRDRYRQPQEGELPARLRPR